MTTFRSLVFSLFFVLIVLATGISVAQDPVIAQPESLWTRSVGTDWPVFLGPSGDGKSTEKGILKDWSKGNLKVVWKTETGEGYGMGTVAKGRFYHFGRFKQTATLRCLNAETGKQLWEFSYESDYNDLYGYDSGPRASPVLDDGLVYLYGVEGLLHCLDANTGAVRWKLNATEKFGVIQNFFGVASTPVVFKDLLIVMVGGSPNESKAVPPGALDRVKPNGTGLIAVDKKTGELKYKSVNDLASYSSLKMTRLGDAPVLLAWMRGSLFGVEPQDGNILFEFPWRSRKLESVNASTPVVKDEHVLISECYEIGSALLKIRGTNPELVWSGKGKRNKSLEAHWNTPILIGDSLFGCSGRHSGPAELCCVDWTTGKVHWKQPGLSRTSLTYIDDHFIVLGEHGKFLLIEANAQEFAIVTEYEPGDGENSVEFKSPCWAAPIVSHGLLYVRGKDQLVCFDLIPESK